MSVDQYTAGSHIVKTGDQIGQSRFTAAGLSHHRYDIAAGNIKTHIIDHHAVVIAETDIAKFDPLL